MIDLYLGSNAAPVFGCLQADSLGVSGEKSDGAREEL